MNTKFGWVAPEVLEKHERYEGYRRRFATALHDQALKLQELFTDEGDEGSRGFGLEYHGQIVGNYPWLYIDFRVTGAMPLENLVRVETAFREICTSCEQLASYLSTTLSGDVIRCRLLYRADMPRAL